VKNENVEHDENQKTLGENVSDKAKTVEAEVIGFKGFDKNLKCRDFQFEVGKKYVHEGVLKLCASGFHYVEYPLDIFQYYAPNEARFAEVVPEGVSDQRESGDSKRAAKGLTIKAEISLKAVIEAAVKFTFARVDWIKGQHATGYQGAASATGDQGAASATGYQGAASATGDQGAASATGYQGAASATGVRGAASATGYQGAASATGVRGAASATGDQGAASATGVRGAASATGYQGAASATGVRGAASATGDQGAASATGDQGAASATGYQGAASATGDQGAAVALGGDAKARGEVGCWLTVAEWRWMNGDYHRVNVKTVRVDGKKIKANTFYALKSGKFVEVD